jgi:hypothetical protein
MFSCLCDVAISFFKNCNELVDPVSLKSIGFMEKIEEKNPKIFKFSYGKKQIFAAGEAKFDLNREFNENNETSEYSLVIKLETEDILEKEAIFTYCSINSTGKIEVLKQKIEMGENALIMNEIFGSTSGKEK